MRRPRSFQGRVAPRRAVQFHFALDVVAHRAVPDAVDEIDQEAGNEPHHQADPRVERQKHHHGQVDQDPQRSKEEQGRRFDERLTDPRKNWKASPSDYKEREFWDQYQEAYEDALIRCSTKDAPWYIIPSDHRWFRNFAVSEIIIKTLESFKMRYPRLDKKTEPVRQDA